MALAVAQTVLMVNDSSSSTTYTSGTTITPAGSTLVVALISGCSDTSGSTPSISSITLGGVAMTVQGAIQDVAGGRNWTAIATLNNAAASASSISITMAALNRAMRIRCVEVTGHDTTSPIAQNFGASQNSNVTTITQTASVINAGAMFLGCVGVQSGTANTTIVANDAETILATSGRTGSTGFSDISGQGAWEIHAATGSQTFGFDWTGANFATLKVIEIKPAAGGTPVTANAGAGSVTIQGAAPTSSAAVTAAAGAGSVSVQGMAVTAAAAVLAALGVGTVSIQGYAPTASAAVSVMAGVGSVDIQGYAPSVSVSGSVAAVTGTGSVNIVGYAPTVSVGGGEQQQPGGFIPRPVKYLDQDGNEVSLDEAVKDAVSEAVRKAPPAERRAAVAVSRRVLDALGRDTAPQAIDLSRLEKLLAGHFEALAALEEMIARQDDDTAAVLLLMGH